MINRIKIGLTIVAYLAIETALYVHSAIKDKLHADR